MNLADYQHHFLASVRFQEPSEALLELLRGPGRDGCDKRDGGEERGEREEHFDCAAPAHRLGPEESLELYRRMYWYRLVDALLALFPKTARWLGGRRFTTEACAFLTEMPSSEPVLERLAGPFARFLFRRHGAYIATDLARLEADALEALLAPDGQRPQLRPGHVLRPDFSEHHVALSPSLRVGIVGKTAWGLYHRISSNEPLEEHSTWSSEERSTTEETGQPQHDMPMGYAFLRPHHGVLNFELAPSEALLLRTLAGRIVPVGPFLEALSTHLASVQQLAERLSFFIAHDYFEWVEEFS